MQRVRPGHRTNLLLLHDVVCLDSETKHDRAVFNVNEILLTLIVDILLLALVVQLFVDRIAGGELRIELVVGRRRGFRLWRRRGRLEGFLGHFGGEKG
jgi:hypothetical protein